MAEVLPVTLVRAMRPRQWVKNGVVLAALVFALGDRSQAVSEPWRAFAAAFCFCLMSSFVYLVNDLRDVELDRVHPQKKLRPIASGSLPEGAAKWAAVLLFVVALCGAWWVRPAFAWVLGGYALLQLAYCFGLKKVAVVDVLCIASGFVLRALSGALAIDVHISPWLLGCTFLLATFLGLCKRRHEKVVLADLRDQARPSLGGISAKMLDRLIRLAGVLTLLAYVVYTLSSSTLEKFGNARLLTTAPLVALGLWRYNHLVYQNEEGGRPEHVLLTDPVMIAVVCAYGLLAAVLMLMNPGA